MRSLPIPEPDPMPLRRLLSLAGSTTLFAFAAVTPLSAQSLWPDSLRGTVEFGVEWIRPTMSVEDGLYSSTRGVWTVSGRIRIKPDLELVAALPTFVADDQGFGVTGGSGNPYIGLLMLDPHGRPRVSVGYRPGSASRTNGDSPTIGAVADNDRLEAAYSGPASINAVILHDAYRGENGTNIRLRVGTMLAFAAGDGGIGKNLYFDYGLRIGRDTPMVRAGLAFTGRWWMDSRGAGWSEASNHQAAVDFSFLQGAIRPYLGARLPLDKPLSNSLDYALIFGLTAAVK
ncbi:MAG: hypothetical protein JF590_03440 [Gemmatimonadetes bacterium]|nr:hypothetical protein [Gemmatimonadota bacterium]